MARGVEEIASDLRVRAAAHAGPPKSARERIAEIDWHIGQTALKYGVRPEIIKRIIKQESGGNPNAVGRDGEIGLMQLMPETARDYNVNNSYDPKQNIEGGVHYFADLLKKKGNEAAALIAYNGSSSYLKHFRDLLTGPAVAGAKAAGPVAEALRERPAGPRLAEGPRPQVEPTPLTAPPPATARATPSPAQAPPGLPPAAPSVRERLAGVWRDIVPALPSIALGLGALGALRGRGGPRRPPEIPPRELPGMPKAPPEAAPEVPRATKPEVVPEPEWSKRAKPQELPGMPRPEMPPTPVRRPGQKPVEEMPLFASVRERLRQSMESMQQRMLGPEARPFEPERAPAVRDFRETAARVEPRLGELERRAGERPTEGVKPPEAAQIELPKPRPVEEVRAPALEGQRLAAPPVPPRPAPIPDALAAKVLRDHSDVTILARNRPQERFVAEVTALPRVLKRLTDAGVRPEEFWQAANRATGEVGRTAARPVTPQVPPPGIAERAPEGPTQFQVGERVIAAPQPGISGASTGGAGRVVAQRPSGLVEVQHVGGGRILYEPSALRRVEPEPPPATGDMAPGVGSRAALMPPIPLPGPPDDEKRPWVRGLERAGQVAGMALPLLGLAGLRGRGRGMPPIGRPGGAEAFRPPSVPPDVLPQFRRESIRPLETSATGEAGGGGGGGRGPSSAVPPGPLPGGVSGGGGRTGWGDPNAPVPPGPLGVSPTVVDGSGAKGLHPIPAYLYQTLLSRFETWGPAGQEVSRLIRGATSQRMRWFAEQEHRLGPVWRLTDREANNLVDVAEGKAAPINSRVARAHDSYLPIWDDPGVIPDGARARNILIMLGQEAAKLFKGRPKYYPHEFSPEFVKEVLREGSPARQRAAEQLAERRGISVEDAKADLDMGFGAKITRYGGKIFELEPDRFVGGLERTRELDIDGWIRDPRIALRIRLWKVARRFAEIDHYGLLDAKIGNPSNMFERGQRVPPSGLMAQIEQQFGTPEASKAYVLFQRIVGKQIEQGAVEQAMGKLNRVALPFQTAAKMSYSVLLHAGQSALLGVRTDVATMARAITRSVTAPGAGRTNLADLGFLARETMRDVYTSMGLETGGPRPLNYATRFTLAPFNIMLRANEIVAGNAGRLWAHKLDRWIADGQRGEWLHRELTNLGFSRDEIDGSFRDRGLSKAYQDRVAWEIVDQTMYTGSGKARRSEFQTTAIGRTMLQFRFWGINTGRLLHQRVWREIQAGNYAPLARMIVLFPLFGEMVQDVRALARGTARPDPVDHPIKRFMEDFFVAGGFAIVSELFEAIERRGALGATEFVAGPFFSDVAELGARGARLLTAAGELDGDKVLAALKSTGRYAARDVPFLGPHLARWLRSDPAAAKEAQRTWQDRLGFDSTARMVTRAETEQRRIRKAQKEANRLAGEGKPDEARKIIQATPGAHLSPSAIARRRQQVGSPDEDAARRQYRERINRLSPALRGRLRQDMSEAER